MDERKRKNESEMEILGNYIMRILYEDEKKGKMRPK